MTSPEEGEVSILAAWSSVRQQDLGRLAGLQAARLSISLTRQGETPGR